MVGTARREERIPRGHSHHTTPSVSFEMALSFRVLLLLALVAVGDGTAVSLTAVSLKGYKAISSSSISTSHGGDKGVDGVISSTGGRVQTNAEQNAWFAVDLGVEGQRVKGMKIYTNQANTACAYWMLKGSGNCAVATGTGDGIKFGVATTQPSGNTDLWGGTVCKTITTATEIDAIVAAGNFFEFSCPEGTAGRYLWVQTPGTSRKVHLEEVQADLFNLEQNPVLLTGMTATQSSMYGSNPASAGIDALNAFPLAHTACEGDDNDWWQVDLGETKSVYNIMIMGRSDSTCMYRWFYNGCAWGRLLTPRAFHI